MERRLLVFGAKGAVGREVVSRALEEGFVVRAADRGDLAGSFPSGEVETRSVDVLNDDLAPLMEGVDAVVSALGLPLSPRTVVDPPPLYTGGTSRIVGAMKQADLRRLVVISASFVADRHRGPLWFRAAAMPALWRIFDQMRDMEHVLAATDSIEWTAVRPGWLLDAPFTGDYAVAEDVIPRGTIRTRIPDLAHFLVRCASGHDWVRGTPAIARREPLRYTGPHAMTEELRPLLRQVRHDLHLPRRPGQH